VAVVALAAVVRAADPVALRAAAAGSRAAFARHHVASRYQARHNKARQCPHFARFFSAICYTLRCGSSCLLRVFLVRAVWRNKTSSALRCDPDPRSRPAPADFRVRAALAG
jgi:hypothetical protein